MEKGFITGPKGWKQDIQNPLGKKKMIEEFYVVTLASQVCNIMDISSS